MLYDYFIVIFILFGLFFMSAYVQGTFFLVPLMPCILFYHAHTLFFNGILIYILA